MNKSWEFKDWRFKTN